MLGDDDGIREEARLSCSHSGCGKTIADHRWGRTKSGWFEQQDGKRWCPQHIPDWVITWRARKADKPQPIIMPGDA